MPKTPVSNVTLTKTASNSSPNVGQQFSYTVTANNSGAAAANNVTVTDNIPAGLTFNSYTASQGTYNSATGIWNVGTITSGANAVLTLYVTPTASVAGTTVINSATIPGQIATATVAVPKTPVSNTSPSANVTVHVPKHNVTSSSSKQNVNSSTVPMLPTGAPLMPLLLGALMMVAGFANNARKKLK